MSNRDVLAIGASAGGIDALVYLARHFPADFPAAIVATVHLSPYGGSSLDRILGNAGPLPAKFAIDGAPVERGTIHLAPPDRHLIMDRDRLWLGDGPRENNSRPAIDPMLRSVAACCGARAVGAVLTGTLGDGASGLWTVGQLGGCTVVQDPDDAAFSEMPINALKLTQPDHVVALDAMPALLTRLAHQKAGDPKPISDRLSMEVKIARGRNPSVTQMDRLGRRSVFTCPDCGGAMWEIDEGNLSRFRCHVGHAYTHDLMSLALDENLYRALATALRTLEDRAELASRLQREAEDRRQPHAAGSWAGKADEFRRELEVIEGALQRMDEITAMRNAGQDEQI